MNEQEELNIYNFKRGDIITRLKPITDEIGEKDYSLIGAKLSFLGIANASIYISRPLDVLTMLFSGGRTTQTIKLPLELWQNGWGYYIEPDFLDEDLGLDISEEQALQDQIDQAIIEENYQKAEVLKKRLDKIKKEKNGGAGEE